MHSQISKLLLPPPVQTHWWKDYLLIFAILLACLIHGIILSIRFVMDESQSSATQEVSVAVNLTKEKVEDADFIAQANQKGDGDLKKAEAQTTPIPLVDPENSIGEKEEQMLEQLAQKPELTFEERMLMTTLSWQKQKKDEERKKQKEEQNQQRQARAAMIANIEAQYSQRQQMYANSQKVKTVTGIQAKQDASSAYLDKFRQKVEMFGNRYYPEEAKRQGLSGEVRLMVIINKQGGLRALHLLQSSGNAVLDEAAKASVRRAMPFGAFDSGMKDITELRIVRTWRFEPGDAAFSVK